MTTNDEGPTSPQAATLGRARLQFTRRLQDDWRDLVDLLETPPEVSRRFQQGAEASAIWEWLQRTGRLRALPAALEEIKRRDLAITLKDAFEAADLRSSAVAAKADWATEPAQSGGSPSRRPRRHLTWAALVLSMVLVGIAAFVVQLSPDGLTHEGFDVLPTGSPTGGPTATPSEDHVGGTPDATTTRTPTRTTSDSPPPTTSTAWVNGECYGRPELHRGDQVGLSACDSVGGGTDLTFDGVGIVVRSDIVTKVANSRGNRAATGYSTCSGIFNPSRLPASSPITGAACLQSPQYYGYVDVVEVNATRAIVVVMSWARKDI